MENRNIIDKCEMEWGKNGERERERERGQRIARNFLCVLYNFVIESKSKFFVPKWFKLIINNNNIISVIN